MNYFLLLLLLKKREYFITAFGTIIILSRLTTFRLSRLLLTPYCDNNCMRFIALNKIVYRCGYVHYTTNPIILRNKFLSL